MPFGTENIQYGEGLGDTDFGAGGQSIYEDYMQDTYVSEDVDVEDYLYTYDPLKEQNLLADYMSGLVDFGDKKEDVRTKAIAERKALSKSIRGGLSSGAMESMEREGEEAASRATASLYRGQFGAQRQLGEDIGSLREAYEADIAQGVLDYNEAVGEGQTIGELTEQAPIVTSYANNYGVSDPDGDYVNAIQPNAPSGDYAIAGATDPDYGVSGGDDHNDTWLNRTTGNWYQYWDGTFMGMGAGEWQSKGKWNG